MQKDSSLSFQNKSVGIKTGILGSSLYHILRFMSFSDTDDLRRSVYHFENSLKMINNNYNSDFIFNDLTEMLYLLEIISDESKGEYQNVKLKRQLSKIIFDYSKKQIDNNNLDPYLGGFYQAFYFLFVRDYKKLDSFYLDAIVGNIEKVENDSFTLNSNFEPGKLYISFSHGMSAYLLLLSEMYRFSKYKEKIYCLIQGLSNFIMSLQSECQSKTSFFPDYIPSTQKSSALSLSYGDTMIIYVLYRASIILKIDSFTARVVDMINLHVERISRNIENHKRCSFFYGLGGLYLFLWNLSKSLNSKQVMETMLLLSNELMYSDLSSRFPNENTFSFFEGHLGISALKLCVNDRQFELLSRVNLIY